MSKKALTDNQRAVYDFLISQLNGGLPPTVREICEFTGIKSTSTVHGILGVLEKEGYIVRDAGSSRAIKLDMGTPTSMVPLVGRVAAGQPILAAEEIEDYIPYPTSSADGLFALKVVGLSMKDAGILDGDIVIVEKTSVCSNGEIVVALIEDEATVKRFYKENGHFRLQPENDAYAPIITNELSILGRVVSVIRYY